MLLMVQRIQNDFIGDNNNNYRDVSLHKGTNTYSIFLEVTHYVKL